MTRRRDSRPEVDVKTHVSLRGACRRTRVDAHAHPHRTAGERALPRPRRGRRRQRVREREEEGVALGIDLDAAVLPERIAQRAPVLRERCLILRTELAQQARRALDVGEEQGDGAVRELRHRERTARGPPLRRV